MVTLDIKEQRLNTENDFSIQLEDQNPATVFDTIPGNKATGIEIPVNDQTRKVLNNRERFEKMGSINDSKFEGAILRHFGQVIQRGTLIIDEPNSKKYGGWLRDVVGDLAERVANRFINQSTLRGEQSFVNKTSYSPETDDYACPKIFNRNFWRDRGKKVTEEITGIDLEGAEYTTQEEQGKLTSQFFKEQSFLLNNPTATGVVTSGIDTAPVVSPMLFFWKALELILSENLIFVKENFLKEHPDLKKLILYNNYNIVKQSFVTETKLIFWLEYDEFLEVEQEQKTITNVTYNVDKFFFKDLIPKIELGKLVLWTQNLLNVVFSFNDLNECRIVDRQKLLIDEPFDIDEYMVGDWELGERKNVAIKLNMEHDPLDSAFSDNWQDLSDLRQNIKEPVSQKSDLPTPEDLKGLTLELDDIRKVTGENKYYQYHWHVITAINEYNNEEEVDILGWEAISIGFQPFFFNDDGEKEVEEIGTGFSTLRQSDNGYPITMQKGNSESFKTQWEQFTPRLLFYEGDEYASNRTNSISLDWDGRTGLASTRWNYWLPFWANRLPAKALFKLPASIYHYIKNNMHAVPFRTRHGSFIIDSIDAIASSADTISATLQVFKRESVVTYQTGNVPGSGSEQNNQFIPLFVGVTKTGKPYLVNGVGEVRILPAWGTLSPASYSRTTCIDYDPISKQLFVGGYGGTLYVSDLADVEHLRMKAIKVFASGNVSSVGFANGQILIGKDGSNQIYRQPFHSDLYNYQDNEATLTGNFPHSGIVKGFAYADGNYFGCTWNGESIRSSNLNGWEELQDRDAHFTRMAVTSNRLWCLDYDDRSFWAERTNPNSWHEFDIAAGEEPEIIEAVPLNADILLLITTDEYRGARLIVDTANRDNLFTPSLAKECGGACALSYQPCIAIKEGSGATKIAIQSVVQQKWNYINVPAFFSKLFHY